MVGMGDFCVVVKVVLSCNSGCPIVQRGLSYRSTRVARSLNPGCTIILSMLDDEVVCMAAKNL